MTTQTKSRGFTIVELLIVIIVIAILAAITIVAYNGITNRANASAGKQNATSVGRVSSAYAADDTAGNGVFPTQAQLIAYTTTTKIPSGVTVVTTQLDATHKNGKTIQYTTKGTSPNFTGACIGSWDNSLGTPAVVYTYVGDASTGGNAATPTCT